MRPLVLGTRGSDLARAQTSLVEQLLRSKAPSVEVAVQIITTSGDQGSASFQLADGRGRQVENLHYGRKGMFTAEIERALRDRGIDVAVHSAKDLPSDASAGLEICAALPRAAVEDVLITKEGRDLSSLPPGATIATGSVRRQHQLRLLRPDLQIADLRGNVPTRLRKLTTTAWDGIILARAGLERLGFEIESGALRFEERQLRISVLSRDQFLPAGGQGIVALQIRSDDEETRSIIAQLNDAPSLLCLRAEREFLRLLRGDCGTPVGVLATIEDGAMEMRAQLFEEGRAQPRAAALEKATVAEPEALAQELWEMINGAE